MNGFIIGGRQQNDHQHKEKRNYLLINGRVKRENSLQDLIVEWSSRVEGKLEGKSRIFVIGERIEELANYLALSTSFIEQFEKRWNLKRKELEELFMKLVSERKFTSKFLMKYLSMQNDENNGIQKSERKIQRNAQYSTSDHISKNLKSLQSEYYKIIDVLRKNGVTNPGQYIESHQEILQRLYGTSKERNLVLNSIISTENPLSIGSNIQMDYNTREDLNDSTFRAPEEEEGFMRCFLQKFDDSFNLHELKVGEMDVIDLEILIRSPAITPQSVLNHHVNVPIGFISKHLNEISIHQRVSPICSKVKVTIDQCWNEMEKILEGQLGHEVISNWKLKDILRAYTIGKTITDSHSNLLDSLNDMFTFFQSTTITGSKEKVDAKYSKLCEEVSQLDKYRDLYHHIFQFNSEAVHLINRVVQKFFKESEEAREFKTSQVKQQAKHKLSMYNHLHRLARYLLQKPSYSFLDNDKDESGIAFFEMHDQSIEKRRELARNFISNPSSSSLHQRDEHINTSIVEIQQLISNMLNKSLSTSDIKTLQESVSSYEDNVEIAKGNTDLFPQKGISHLAQTLESRFNKLNNVQHIESSNTESSPEQNFPSITSIRKQVMNFLTTFVLKSSIGKDTEEHLVGIFGCMSPIPESELTLYRLMTYDYQRARLFKILTDKGVHLLPQTHLLIKDLVSEKYTWLSTSQKLKHYKAAYCEAHYFNEMSQEEITTYEDILLRAVPLLIRRGQDISSNYTLHDRISSLKDLIKRTRLNLKHSKQSLQYPSLVLLKFLYHNTSQIEQKELIFSKWNQFHPSHFKYILTSPNNNR
ncbi:predicted protein [Naegleria gruberi]|uniref:Predicted protein n=1 Tax=Naegleria gruberi TaxID=5762 RepID=D2V3Z7_NAEGR|nr:uncharacterized protein NAEGRDRAFT_63545 [Naegleria gruberi]EFC48436.1 predicted protein [Naegleria gruberi]|eukprot:XP_002681180.1 predicted protein [Naegleria gruberi strain NEG-M]